MSASKVPASVTTRFAAGSIDRTDVCRNRTPGLSDVAVLMADVGRHLPAEHHVELGEAENERIALVDEDDVEGVPEGIGKNSHQLEAAEAGAEHNDACLHGVENISVQSGPWHGSSGPSPARTRPPSASRSTATSRTIPRGRRSSSTTSRCSAWLDGQEARRAGVHLQRPRDVVLLRSLFGVHARHRRAVSGGGRRRRPAGAAAGDRPPGARAPHRPGADGRRVRHVVLPGQAARSRPVLAAVDAGPPQRRRASGRRRSSRCSSASCSFRFRRRGAATSSGSRCGGRSRAIRKI